MRQYLWAIAALAVGSAAMAGAQASTFADDAIEACVNLPSGRKAPLVKDGASYMIVATMLEQQGRGKLRPEYDAPESLCAAGNFEVGSIQVDAYYAGFQKGAQTLLYLFETRGAEPREILVLYSGMLSFMQGEGSKFHVSETRGDHVDIYAIYDREPPYAQARALVEDILAGSQQPLIAAEWQEGEDELIITVYDDDRLK